MKKFAKYFSIIICVALFIFLMLPFLEPPTLNDASANKNKDSQVVPQIFTSNPLTDIVKRIARFFGKQHTSDKNQRTANTTQRGGSRYAVANLSSDGQNMLAAANGSATVIPADPNAADPTVSRVLDENGEWVLVQQRMPEAAQAGMHEISVKEDAYERYIKQERTARFTPAANTKYPKAVPDSKLARLFQPIKRFFGFGDEATVASSGALGNSAGETGALASATSGYGIGRSDRLGKNTGTPMLQKPKALEADFNPQQFNAVVGNNSTGQTVTLSDLLDPSQDIEDAANMIADSIPSTGDPKKDAKAREEMRQKKNEEFWNRTSEKVMANQQELSGGEKPQDPIDKTGGCDTREPLLKNGGAPVESCSANSERLISSLQEKNKDAFKQELERKQIKGKIFLDKKMHLTPILGVADISSVEKIQNIGKETLQDTTLQEMTVKVKAKAIPYDLDILEKSTQEMYKYMLQHGNCTDNSCLWVANNVPTDDVMASGVSDTVTAAGFTFTGDPLHKFEQLKQNFVAEKLSEFDKENPESSKEEREKYEAALKTAMPPYVIYTKQDTDELAQQIQFRPPSRSQAGQSNRLNTSLYFSNAAEALNFTQTYGASSPAFYGSTGHKVLQDLGPQTTGGAAQTTQMPGNMPQEQDNTSLTERSGQLVRDIVSNIEVIQSVITEIKQEAGREAVHNTITPSVQQTKKEIEEKLKKDMKKTSDVGTYSR